MIGMLAALSGPAIRTLKNQRPSGEALSAALRLARSYAVANNAYVRVGFAQTDGGADRTPTTVVVFLYQAQGDIASASTADMADSSKWPALVKPLVLENVLIYPSLEGSAPDTSRDLLPTQSNVAGFSRRVSLGGRAPQAITFFACIQFQPNGEARVDTGETARYIKIPLDRPRSFSDASPRGRDPAIVRLSGVNGSISVLRKGEGI
ncbi:MAG TPA: hypothetical protein VIM58_06145 [Candidatus Methylacidiphilales bacterium]